MEMGMGIIIGAVGTLTVLFIIGALEEKRRLEAELWLRHKGNRGQGHGKVDI